MGTSSGTYSVDPVVLEGSIATKLGSAADGVSSARASVASSSGAFDGLPEPTRSAGYAMHQAINDALAAVEGGLTALQGTTKSAGVAYATTNDGVTASLTD